MKEITLHISIDEINMILEGLGHLPFAIVYILVAKLQEQAAPQLNGDQAQVSGTAQAAAQAATQAATKPDAGAVISIGGKTHE